jgi:NTE family protein
MASRSMSSSARRIGTRVTRFTFPPTTHLTFLPGAISDHVSEKYDSLLFHGKTLQDLPAATAGPRFVINLTNVQSGVPMRFSMPYMRGYRVGEILNPSLPLARAVAASSAFPPVLSPCGIDLSKYGLKFQPSDGTEDLNKEPYTTKPVLSDGWCLRQSGP